MIPLATAIGEARNVMQLAGWSDHVRESLDVVIGAASIVRDGKHGDTDLAPLTIRLSEAVAHMADANREQAATIAAQADQIVSLSQNRTV